MKGNHCFKGDKDTFSDYKREIFIQNTIRTHEQIDILKVSIYKTASLVSWCCSEGKEAVNMVNTNEGG